MTTPTQPFSIALAAIMSPSDGSCYCSSLLTKASRDDSNYRPHFFRLLWFLGKTGNIPYLGDVSRAALQYNRARHNIWQAEDVCENPFSENLRFGREIMFKQKKLALAATILLGMSMSGAQAALVTIDYTGTATGVGGLAAGFWAGQGTDVFGTYFYDDAATDSNGGTNLAINKFQSQLFGNDDTNLWGITFNLGGISRSVDSSGPAFTFLNWDRAADIYSFSQGLASIFLSGGTGGVTNTDNSAPSVAPDLSLFTSRPTGLYKVEGSANQLGFTITSLTTRITTGGGGGISVVPLPAALPLFLSAMGLLGFMGRRGRRQQA